MEEIRLIIPSRLELLSIVDKVVEGVADQLAFEDDDKDEIAIAVVEAGTNAIQHGHACDAARAVEVFLRIVPGQIEIEVRDTGPGFDLALVEDATAPENLLKPRGRGIFIMRSLMDEVSYTFSPSGTTCRLVKKKRDSDPPDAVEADAGARETL